MSTLAEALRIASYYPTDRILGIGCHERDWGDTLFQRPADAVTALLFKACHVRT
jgi:hypothetical protein